MKTIFLVASACFFVSCAHTRGESSSGGDAPAGHGPDCSCHGEKASAHHQDKKHAGGHTATNVTEHVEALFTRLDADGDNALTREEIGEHHLARKFDKADADGDGTISREEMMAFGKKMHAMRAARGAEAAPETETPAPEAEATPDKEAPATE